MPSVLITGAGRGIGRSTALTLAAAGWTSSPGCATRPRRPRRPRDRPGASRRSRSTSPPPRTRRPRRAVPARLDALVNNAGIVVGGPVEAGPLDELRRQLEVNVVAQVAVTQALLPAPARDAGRIVLVSSVSGRSDAVHRRLQRVEVRDRGARRRRCASSCGPWGIAVFPDVQPGRDVDSGHLARRARDRRPGGGGDGAAHRALYPKQTAGLRLADRRTQNQTGPPERVAEAVHKALTAKRPRERYLVGADARVQLALRALLRRAASTRRSRVSRAGGEFPGARGSQGHASRHQRRRAVRRDLRRACRPGRAADHGRGRVDGPLGGAVLRAARRGGPVRHPLRPSRHGRLDDVSAGRAGLLGRRPRRRRGRRSSTSSGSARPPRRPLDGRRDRAADRGRSPRARAQPHAHVHQPDRHRRPRAAAHVRGAARRLRRRRAAAEPDWSDREAPSRTCSRRSAPSGLARPRRGGDARPARPGVRPLDDMASANNHFLVDGTDCRAAGWARSPSPTLVIHGTDDPLFPPAHGEALAREIPGAGCC